MPATSNFVSVSTPEALENGISPRNGDFAGLLVLRLLIGIFGSFNSYRSWDAILTTD